MNNIKEQIRAVKEREELCGGMTIDVMEDYLEAASPDVVLGLLSDLEAMEEENDKISELWSQMRAERDELRDKVTQYNVNMATEMEKLIDERDAEVELRHKAEQGLVDWRVKHMYLEAERNEYQRAADDMAAAHKVERDELMEQLETERMRLAACGVAALGYFDGCKYEYRSASLEDVLRMQAKLAAYESKESRKPQAWLWQYADGDWHDQPFDTLANCEREFAEFEGQAHPLFTAPEGK